jgi:hypothetical protein
MRATVQLALLLALVAALSACGGSGGTMKTQAQPAESCADQVRDEIRVVEEAQGFSPDQFRIPIAHCHPFDEEGTDLWASAQLVWNNGKIVWWDCRDLAHCVPT